MGWHALGNCPSDIGAVGDHLEINWNKEEESINIPKTMDQLLSDYARRYNEIKTPRKLLWKKNLGIVKLELQFGDATAQFIVDPVNAAIIMHFQGQTSWTSKDLAAAIGIPVEALNRRINFWISKMYRTVKTTDRPAASSGHSDGFENGSAGEISNEVMLDSNNSRGSDLSVPNGRPNMNQDQDYCSLWSNSSSREAWLHGKTKDHGGREPPFEKDMDPKCLSVERISEMSSTSPKNPNLEFTLGRPQPH